MLQKRVTTDRTFVEADYLGPLIGRPTGELFDSGQVECLIAVAMFKLGDGDSDIANGRFLATRPKEKVCYITELRIPEFRSNRPWRIRLEATSANCHKFPLCYFRCPS
jgi:hypothetical protein